MKEETYIGIIPARYQSSRFPGKPLCDISGKAMIQRVYESVMKWDKWEKVLVATDSEEIIEFCIKKDIPCIMTSYSHTDCLDRAAEVVRMLEENNDGASKYIVIQGDEPLFNVDTLNTDLSPSIINFYTKAVCDKYDGNAVKVVVSRNSKAIYFSRYSVPSHSATTKRTNEEAVVLKQIGVYVFSGEMLKLYSTLDASYLENMEGIGLNRLIENDIDIYMRHTNHDSISVDTPEDRDRVEKLIHDDIMNNTKLDDSVKMP